MSTENGVRIESRSGLGNVLVATRAYKAGEVVVCEHPLLHVPHLKPSNPLYKPLQSYFEQHGIPPSVVLKIVAYFTAPAAEQAKVLQCASPDPAAFADAAVVQQAQLFAGLLMKHPPVPEFAGWVEAAAAAASTSNPRQQQQLSGYDLLVKLWLVWVTNGHSFRMGSALFQYGSKLTHTCSAPNTAYRTASGETASVHGMQADSGSSSTPGQLPPTAAAASPAAAAGYHVALADIQPGEVLTTNYLGLGHKRLMSTPARLQLLQSKFLFKCTCDRCTQQPDLARGVPCPSCSGPFRAPDKLLKAEVALPAWDNHTDTDTAAAAAGISGNVAGTSTLAAAGGLSAIPETEETDEGGADAAGAAAGARARAAAGAGAATAAAAGAEAADTGTAAAAGDGVINIAGSSNSSSGSSSSSSGDAKAECGYVYCDMPQLLLGAAKPWRCDACGATFANTTLDLWGRYYTRSHANIESDMETWVTRLDESIDTTPFIRVPSSLHDRVVGVLRLLGPRHWASWRLLLLGVELHCGVLEQAVLQFKVSPTSPDMAAAAAAGQQPGPQQQQQAVTAPLLALQNTAEDASCWVVSYCNQLWQQLQHVYGNIEAGQVLGYHFTEAAQVLLQVASATGLLGSAEAEALLDAALQLQHLILPGMRSIMGEDYSPLTQLLRQQMQQQQQQQLGMPATAAAVAADVSGVSSSAVLAGSEGREGASRPGRYVAASVKRYMQQQAAEVARVQAAVDELRQLETAEGQHD